MKNLLVVIAISRSKSEHIVTIVVVAANKLFEVDAEDLGGLWISFCAELICKIVTAAKNSKKCIFSVIIWSQSEQN